MDNNLLLTSILLFRFSLLVLNFNFHFKSILFYIFNLIFIRRLFLLILFILSIRRLILNSFYNFNYFNVILLVFIILIIKVLNKIYYFDIKFKFCNNFRFSYTFSIFKFYCFIILMCKSFEK